MLVGQVIERQFGTQQLVPVISVRRPVTLETTFVTKKTIEFQPGLNPEVMLTGCHDWFGAGRWIMTLVGTPFSQMTPPSSSVHWPEIAAWLVEQRKKRFVNG